jgi:predicted GIY-YIG superfamily endonuclease
MNIQKVNKHMSSREIAELTGKAHGHVKRDIVAMLESLKLDASNCLGFYQDSQNREQTEYSLNFHLASTLVSGYSLIARLKIISRLEEYAVIAAINEFEIPEDLPDMYVYAIRESDTRNIKIGISKDPEQRLKQLQTGNSQKLELVAYRKAENRYKDEASLHLTHKAEQVRSEWFSIKENEVTDILEN